MLTGLARPSESLGLAIAPEFIRSLFALKVLAPMKPMEIDVSQARDLLSDPSVVLIDCREPEEYATAKIDGAVLMPMSQWQDAGEQLSEMQGKHLVVYCHHGMRSLRVTNWLRENGFPDAQSMSGGIHAWSTEIDPSVPQY